MIRFSYFTKLPLAFYQQGDSPIAIRSLGIKKTFEKANPAKKLTTLLEGKPLPTLQSQRYPESGIVLWHKALV